MIGQRKFKHCGNWPLNLYVYLCLCFSFVREQLFVQHPHITELARTLLQVFVSIEMTGQGVEFEQKFNYRRPMYDVLEYLCTKDNHRQALLVSARCIVDSEIVWNFSGTCFTTQEYTALVWEGRRLCLFSFNTLFATCLLSTNA